MNIYLGETFENYIKNQLDTGLYNNASEVVREALRIKIKQDKEEQVKLEALRRDIMVGWKQADNGQVQDFNADDFLAEMDKEIQKDDDELQTNAGS